MNAVRSTLRLKATLEPFKYKNRFQIWLIFIKLAPLHRGGCLRGGMDRVTGGFPSLSWQRAVERTQLLVAVSDVQPRHVPGRRHVPLQLRRGFVQRKLQCHVIATRHCSLRSDDTSHCTFVLIGPRHLSNLTRQYTLTPADP